MSATGPQPHGRAARMLDDRGSGTGRVEPGAAQEG
jgi:hypothetical protein